MVFIPAVGNTRSLIAKTYIPASARKNDGIEIVVNPKIVAR